MSQLVAKASGTLRTAPLLNLLVYARSRRLTGSLVLEDRPRHRSAVVLHEGVPGKVRTADPVALLGPLLVHFGVVDQRAAEATWHTAREEGRLHGEVLLEEGLVSPQALRLALREQLTRKVEELARCDLSTAWGFYEGQDFLASYGGALPVPVEPLALLWRVAKVRYDGNRVEKGLAQIRPRPLRLRDPRCADRLGLAGAERHFVELLARGNVMLDNALFVTTLDEERARTLLYVLVLTGEVVASDPPQRAAAGPRPEPWQVPGRSRTPAAEPPQPRRSVTPAPAPSPPGAVASPAATQELPTSFELPEAPPRSPGPSRAPDTAASEAVTSERQRPTVPGLHALEARAEQSIHDVPTLEPPARGGGEDGEQLADSTRLVSERLPLGVTAPASSVTPIVGAHPAAIPTEVSTIFSLEALKTQAASSQPPTAESEAELAYRRALELLESGDHQAALAPAWSALELAPQSPKLLALCADLESRLPERTAKGEYGDLVALVNQARKADPEDQQIRIHRARVLLRAGHELPAMREYRNVLMNDRRNAEAAHQLRLYKRRNETHTASSTAQSSSRQEALPAGGGAGAARAVEPPALLGKDDER